MPTLYMTFWSVIMVVTLGLGRLRSWRQTLIMSLITAFVLIMSQSLSVQLSISAGLDPSSVFIASADFLRGGPLAWLALLVMPCGWLGPMVGLNLVQRWSRVYGQAA